MKKDEFLSICEDAYERAKSQQAGEPTAVCIGVFIDKGEGKESVATHVQGKTTKFSIISFAENLMLQAMQPGPMLRPYDEG